ncbi:3-hydroxybutyryl-CoA dehydrogenase [candidate division KSB3 bacterium]|uniref:3-hydroxybutyryl-CoA dehydrogenase n=1 Tax=candidate division KSB3 bacterium TaxID=2044937 RepID=A0A9D5JUB4_9BACT|nr:3-hydroxybutyryl-CoA dehydrogenase [candidate division KSB3 bacterium]MBD3324384.1 3-hydroxybutyryl-CoA dehydrogenase [candidate division KSB3 bacterium]
MPPLQRIGIVGCGLSGCGIARVAALSGYAVHICENSQENLAFAFEKSSTFFKRQAMGGILSDDEVQQTLARIHGSIDLEDLKVSDLVIETIPEDLERKIHIHQELDRLCPPQTILVSHSSSFSITAIASATQRPQQVAGLHFFHPIHMIDLVEVVKTSLMSPLTLDTLCDFVRSLNKEPILVADAPGFVVNRLLVAHVLHAIRLVEADIATKEDVDKAMEIGCGYPMGPFTLMDFLGLDRIYRIAQNLYREYQDPQYLPPASLEQLVAAGHLGKKTGQGFYTYP